MKYFRNGLILAVVAVALLYSNSPHSADEIAVSIAIPLLIFNCTPFLLIGLAAVFRSFGASPQADLPLPTKSPAFVNLPPREKIKTFAIVSVVVAMFVAFFASIAIFLGTFLYGYFGIPWAIYPGRELALAIFAITILPFVGVSSFIAGMRYTGRLWNSVIALTIYLKTIGPFDYWPTLPA